MAVSGEQTACRESTAVRLAIYTDVPWAAGRAVTITFGKPGNPVGPSPVEVREPWSTSQLGDVVLLPQSSDVAPYTVEVVLGVTKAPRACSAAAPDGCIIQRRRSSFITHRTLELPIVLSKVCIGVACSDDQTCDALGKCVPSTIDAQRCAESGVCDLPGDVVPPTFASTDGGAPIPPNVYHDVRDSAYWATFDLPSQIGVNAVFEGATFDGRYVYFVPDANVVSGTYADGRVVRYDTTAPFALGAAWSVFDTAAWNSAANGYAGAATDGSNVYFVPCCDNTTPGYINGKVVQYDARKPFAASVSWSMFDMQSLDANAKSYEGAIFDGRYMYFLPVGAGSGATLTSVVGRYDTSGSFTAPSSWAVHSLTGGGYFGGAFDGRYVYLAPGDGASAIARYDTTAPFDAAAAWASLDSGGHQSSGGAIFDGRYLYFPSAPWSKTPGVVLRYDPQAPPSTALTFFDLNAVSTGVKGFYGSAFDGRYVYFVPAEPCNPGLTCTPGDPSARSGPLVRYDTMASFVDVASWTAVDLTTFAPAVSGGFAGAAFDGRYVYLSPYGGGAGAVAMRFDTKEVSFRPPNASWAP